MVLIVFLSGLFIGSFLNMLIDRLPRGEQISKGRSHCDKCKHVLSFFDLVPVLSWVLLGGRCRYCHSPIPGRNTVVELITGALFVASLIHSTGTTYPLLSINFFIIQLLNYSIISCLIVIFFIDLYHQLIPDSALIVASGAAIIRHVLVLGFDVSAYGTLLFSAIGAYVFFYLIYYLTKRKGMGYGDVLFAGFMGLFLGFPGIVYALYAAFLTGGFFSAMLILQGKKRFGQAIAFGPSLVIGVMLSYFGILEPIWKAVYF